MNWSFCATIGKQRGSRSKVGRKDTSWSTADKRFGLFSRIVRGKLIPMVSYGRMSKLAYQVTNKDLRTAHWHRKTSTHVNSVISCTHTWSDYRLRDLHGKLWFPRGLWGLPFADCFPEKSMSISHWPKWRKSSPKTNNDHALLIEDEQYQVVNYSCRTPHTTSLL
jgi:hypothetical protein